MDTDKKKHGFIEMITNGLSSISQIIAARIFPSIIEGAEMVMRNVETSIIRIEKRIIRKITSLLIIWFGGIFLIFALFFFLREYWRWSNATSFFSIGITILVIGLLLKIREVNK